MPLRTPAFAKQDSSVATATTYKLQKLLAQKGLGSRREMETLIASGRVSINGRVAVLGDRIGSEDRVQIDKRVIRFDLAERLPRVLLYHKPEGEIVEMIRKAAQPFLTNYPTLSLLSGLRSVVWILIPAVY